MSKEPLRMCIACRCMKPKNCLIKIVKNKNGDIDLDNNFKKDGRGVYICKDPKCINLVIKKHLLNKALKENVKDEIYNYIEGMINE